VRLASSNNVATKESELTEVAQVNKRRVYVKVSIWNKNTHQILLVSITYRFTVLFAYYVCLGGSSFYYRPLLVIAMLLVRSVIPVSYK
jgi:hypothetical protein